MLNLKHIRAKATSTQRLSPKVSAEAYTADLSNDQLLRLLDLAKLNDARIGKLRKDRDAAADKAIGACIARIRKISKGWGRQQAAAAKRILLELEEMLGGKS